MVNYSQNGAEKQHKIIPMKVILFVLSGRKKILDYTSYYANALSKTCSVIVILPDDVETSLFAKNIILKKIKTPTTALGKGLQRIQFWKDKSLVKWVRNQIPNAIHYVDCHPWYIRYAKSLNSLFQCVTMHNFQPRKDDRKDFCRPSVIRALCTFCDHIFVHTNLQKKALEKQKCNAAISVIDCENYIAVMGAKARSFLRTHMDWEAITRICMQKYPVMQPLSIINSVTHEKVFRLLRNKKGTILDLGAGTGKLSERLHSNNQEVIAADFNKGLFKPTIPFTEFSIEEDWPYEDNSVDHIACIEVIEHLENPWHLFKEAYRVMKPGGSFIITTPNVNSIFSRLLFLFQGRFAHFGLDLNYLHPRKPDYIDFHKSPIFLFLLKEMAHRKFILKRVSANRSVIPFTHITLPFNGLFWGESAIYELQKIKNTTSKR